MSHIIKKKVLNLFSLDQSICYSDFPQLSAATIILMPCIKTENAIRYPVEIIVSRGCVIAPIPIIIDRTPQTMLSMPIPFDILHVFTPLTIWKIP